MSTPEPGSPEWMRLVSSSKVPAILGMSPWESPWSLWQRMSGRVEREQRSTDAMRRGHYLESGVIRWWSDQHPEVGSLTEQRVMRLDDWGIATLDGYATTLDGPVVLEAKTSSSWDEWGEPGTDQIATHYLPQVLWQLALTPDATRAYVAALGPFLDFREYVIDRADYAEDIEATVKFARAFYESLDGDTPPPLDDHVATVATLRRMHPDIERGQSVAIPDDMAAEYLAAEAGAKAADARKRAAQAAVLNAAGSAQYVTDTTDTRVARRQPGRYGVSLVATPPKKGPAA